MKNPPLTKSEINELERIAAQNVSDLCDRYDQQKIEIEELLRACRSLLACCERYLGPMICGKEMTIARAAIEKASKGK